MIPEFDLHSGRAGIYVLPPGLHPATLLEVQDRFGGNPIRKRLMSGLRLALAHLTNAGCTRAYINGSFVTSKPNPGDYDVAWEIVGVDPNRLDPIFWHPAFFSRPEQKRRFGGESFPAISWPTVGSPTLSSSSNGEKADVKESS